MSTPNIRLPLDERTRSRPLLEKETNGACLRDLMGIDTEPAVPGDHLPRREQMRDPRRKEASASELLDQALEQTFPASDAVAIVLPGHA